MEERVPHVNKLQRNDYIGSLEAQHIVSAGWEGVPGVMRSQRRLERKCGGTTCGSLMLF